MKKTEEINDYDYKKMIKDFETSQRFENHIKKIKKRWEEEGKKFQTSIEHMKEFREETYKRKNKELINKLNQKETLLITSLEHKQKDKMKEKERAIALLMEKEKIAKENVEKFMEEQEKLRLLFQAENIQKRIFIYFIINYILYIQLNLLRRETKNKKQKVKNISLKKIMMKLKDMKIILLN